MNFSLVPGKSQEKQNVVIFKEKKLEILWAEKGEDLQITDTN